MIQSFVDHSTFNFPAGEMHIRLNTDQEFRNALSHGIKVTWEFQKNEDIVELLLYCNALKEAGIRLRELVIPYFPFSRQDRVAVPGECFSLRVMCDLVNGLNAEKVVVYDPHSPVLTALLKNCSPVTQTQIFRSMLMNVLEDEDHAVLISPDAGASKKTFDLAKHIPSTFHRGVVECSKRRDPGTGEITGTTVHAAFSLDGHVCVIVDDICDGGRTFIEIAKEIRKNHKPKKIVLMVTHGIFSKGLKVFDGLIDEIFTYKGRYCVTPLLQDTMNRRAV